MSSHESYNVIFKKIKHVVVHNDIDSHPKDGYWKFQGGGGTMHQKPTLFKWHYDENRIFPI